ncbi:MAG: tRNA (adenosine(37)-N6)-threonylcarbamoyltransferase complex dimerization subunit type 1 TsaB [Dysgonamonadaceae bacterium]|jgi:tRNA threonylcarbamoyladenosine biosynthesis protein TsaB|nr:tRNA (adenosine(37)-N6)-threonylcarbamoyltransferase complex dimerization subunit type 1 TsaB [Dysgonamonadaceae bacterium]
MSCIINIETSTKVCSVVLSKDKEILFSKENYSGGSHAELLGVFVLDAVKFARENNLRIDAVAVSAGPGSYTGLRIGISEAKGLCYGLDVPLIALSTLEIMAHQVIQSGIETDYYCPMIDARRMEVYSAIYDRNMNKIKEVSADIIDENAYSEIISKGKICFFGDGLTKCKNIITSQNIIFLEDVYPLASGMVDLAEKKYEQKEFVDLAYFEPFYLKEFIAIVAKNKVI